MRAKLAALLTRWRDTLHAYAEKRFARARELRKGQKVPDIPQIPKPPPSRHARRGFLLAAGGLAVSAPAVVGAAMSGEARMVKGYVVGTTYDRAITHPVTFNVKFNGISDVASFRRASESEIRRQLSDAVERSGGQR